MSGEAGEIELAPATPFHRAADGRTGGGAAITQA